MSDSDIRNTFLEYVPYGEADALLTQITNARMSARLAAKREEGMHGWHTNICNNAGLENRLMSALQKGKMIDVINFAAMIMVREELYGEDA